MASSNDVFNDVHDASAHTLKTSPQSAVAPTAATPAVTSVNDQATSTTLLAANTSRKGAIIFNNSASILYVKLGATASATSFTVKLVQDGFYEVPFGYTGVIDGIWSADSSGAALITELT